jgi:hypothetical protein
MQEIIEDLMPVSTVAKELSRTLLSDLGIPDSNVVRDLTPLSTRVISSVERISRADPANVQEIAASQIQLLGNYYDLVLGQARRSFRWALIAAGVGLAFFLGAVAFLVLRYQDISKISIISGALIEVISAINFYLYGRTSAQLAEFHTRLGSTQRFLLANSLAESLEGEHKQRAREELIRRIADVETGEARKPSKSAADEKPSKS